MASQRVRRYDTKISGMHTVLNNFIRKTFCAGKVFAKLRQRTTIKNRGKLLIKNYCHKREAVLLVNFTRVSVEVWEVVKQFHGLCLDCTNLALIV